MKRSLLLFVIVALATHATAQILYDGMYSSGWEEERDAFIRGEQSSRQQWLIEQERKRQEQERAIQNLRIETPQSKSTSQAEYNRRMAEKNRQIAIRNRQIQRRKQQIAQQRRQQQIAAERRRQEEIRRRNEAERLKREEKGRQAYAETYKSLEGQTRALQDAAAYASGEGAYYLREQHDVSRYETPIQKGTGSVISNANQSPRQKFAMPQELVIDPDRKYNLATWGEVSSDDLHFDNPLPPIPQSSDKEAWFYFHKTISQKRTMAYMAMMRGLEDGELPTAYMVDDGYAFLSKNKNIVYKISGDGQSLLIVNLDEPENAAFKGEIYAETKLGKAVKAKTPLNEKIMDSEVSLDIGNDTKISNKEDGLKIKTEPEDFKKEFGEKSDDTGIGIAAKAEWKSENMSKLKGTYIHFVSDDYALVNSIAGEAGSKIKAEGSVGAKTSANKGSDLGFDASAGIEGLAVSASTGYLHLSDKGVTVREIGVRGGVGASIGAKFGLKGGSLKGGACSFSWAFKSKYYPY